MKFIYVMSNEDKDKLINMGYNLLKEDANNNLYVFQNKDVTTFACEDELDAAEIRFVLTNILTF